MKRMNYMKEDGFTANDPFTERIIGLAIQVHSGLGAGFLESIYHKAMVIELEEAGIPFETALPLEVLYKGRSAGIFVADLVIERKLLLELKAVDIIMATHEVQIVNYLRATGIQLGLILNFGASKLQIKRRYRELPAITDLRLQEV
jgi:GxxExxY protein